jgi:hypothetical protein
MSEAKVGLSANVWVKVVGLFMVVLDLVNAFGFVPLHVLKPAMRINVSINMLFGIAACYSREFAPAMPITPCARGCNPQIRFGRLRRFTRRTCASTIQIVCPSESTAET